jgi:hypothetical protein
MRGRRLLVTIVMLALTLAMLGVTPVHAADPPRIMEQQPRQIPEKLPPIPNKIPPGFQQFVKCPLESIRVEITTPLPASWWNTPQVGNLVNVRLDNIVGKALVCEYSIYGLKWPVMRYFPQGTTNCSPAKTGFSCY